MAAVRILIVDEYPLMRRGIRAVVEAQPGWDVCGETDSGREAVQLARQLKPDVVVLDLALPGLSGLEVTRQIVADRPQTEVLVLSVHVADELVQEVLRAGARGYVLKSDSGERFVDAIEALREHQPFLTPAVTEFVVDGYLRPAGKRTVTERRKLTPREREILQLVAEGKKSKEIASTLRVTVKTVDAHRSNMMRKLRLRSLSDLVRYAIRNNIIQP